MTQFCITQTELFLDAVAIVMQLINLWLVANV